MVHDDKIFEFVAMRANATSNDTDTGLKLFIPMYSAILAGSIWLVDKLGNSVPANYVYLSDSLMALLSLVCCYIVLDNLRAWWGYRTQLSALTKNSRYRIPRPTYISSIMEFVLCAGMVGAAVMYVCFNPLGSLISSWSSLISLMGFR